MKLDGNRLFLAALLAAGLLLPASCSPTPGGIFVTITSSGLDGQARFIRMELHEETEDGEYYIWHEEAGYTLNSSSSYLWNFASVPPGTYVVVAYLDILPYNSSPSTGDAIPSGAYPTVTVTPDDTIPVTINLDTLKP